MAATSKLSFRARNLDASKPMPVYVADELPDLSECTPINRAVAQMPTGMEKDEEMESHLQEAIIAQQACTSGIKVENHVIPTPKVILLDDDYYKKLYPPQTFPIKNRLIKVQASLSVEREQAEYDADSEDERWLAGKDIPINDFEKMMELLESASSDMQICQPREAQSLLKEFDDNLVDDVYDYWLQKRKVAAAIKKSASLIPRIKTDSRRDAPGVVNPYVAFRRRAEKMQTRKNRKNDEESYEKILKLGYDMGKALSLFDMLRKREKTKAALISLDEKLFVERRANSLSFSTNVDSVLKPKPEFYVSFEDIQDENAGSPLKLKSQKRKKHAWSASVSALDKDVVTRAWLKKNADAWNKPPVGISWLTTGCSTSVAAANEAERTASDAEAAVDGRFAFKRRRGCVYRASLPVPTLSTDSQLDGFGDVLSSFARSSSRESQERKTESVAAAAFRDLRRHLYRTFLPSTAAKGVRRCIGYARRRVGRGGRIIFDRFLDSSPSTSHDVTDGYPFVFDSTRTYQLKPKQNHGDDSESLGSEDESEMEKRLEAEYLEREEIYRKRIYEDSEDSLGFPVSINTLVEEGSSSSSDASRVGYTAVNNHFPAVSNFAPQKARLSSVPPPGVFRPSGKNVLDGGASAYSTYQPLYMNQRQTGYAAPFLVNGIPTTSNAKPALTSNSPSTSSCDAAVYQERRVPDGHSRFPKSASSLVSSSQPSEESRSGFYSRLPQLLVASLDRTEEATVQQAGDSSNTSFSYKQRLASENRLPVLPRVQQRQSTDGYRVNGVKRPKVSLSPTYMTAKGAMSAIVAQRSPSVVQDSGLKRLSYLKISSDANPQLNQCVDTKRLELAIAGSGARIKAPVLPTVPSTAGHNTTEPHTPIVDVLKANLGMGIHTSVLGNYSTCSYQAPNLASDALEAYNLSSQKPSTVNTYYAQTDGLGGISSSPDSESMSPPNSTHRCCSDRTSFANLDPSISHPVAVVSGRSNGVTVTSNDSQIAECGVAKQWSVGEIALRKRSYECSQLSQHEICSPPRAAIAAVPCSTASMRIPLTSPIIAVPQDTDGYSEALINHSRNDPSSIGSTTPVAYYVASSLSEHSNEISVSEAPLVG